MKRKVQQSTMEVQGFNWKTAAQYIQVKMGMDMVVIMVVITM